MRLFHGLVLCAAVAPFVACNGDESDPTPAALPLFPADYASSYTEVRNCRQSGDHDLNVIRVLADPAALGPYLQHDSPFPEGAVLLKEEYDFADATCSEAIKQWTVMVRLPAGSSPGTLDWRWQAVDGQRDVTGQDIPRCYGCHSGCTAGNGGYENTCTVP